MYTVFLKKYVPKLQKICGLFSLRFVKKAVSDIIMIVIGINM